MSNRKNSYKFILIDDFDRKSLTALTTTSLVIARKIGYKVDK